MRKQRYWSGHGRTATASTTRLKNNHNNNNNNGFDHEASSSSTSAGCMCAVFQLFDFHPLNQHHQPPVSLNPISPPLDHHLISTGTEAPRNSLESDKEESPLSSTPKQKQDGLHFPKGIVQIKTKSGINGSAVNSNENLSGNSPSTKTPTLVARLMGLDLLPQSNSSPSSSTTPRTASASPIYPILQKPKTANHLMGSRSLPETPRTSFERKSNYVENYHHRLSLQIPNYDKENATTHTPSPTHYAKEIVKQIKETVSRKAGLNDITNYTRRDKEVLINQTKPKRALSSSSSSVSPRLRVLEPKNLNKASPKVVEAIKEGGLGTKPKQKVKTKVALKKGNKQEEPFVVPSKAAIDSPLKKSKKTPLSNELLTFTSLPTLGMKKDSPFSSPIKPTPMLQSPCNRNQAAGETGDKESKRNLQSSNHQPHIPITHHHHHVIQLPPNNNIITTASDDITAELEYVRQILLRRSTTTSSSVYSSANSHYNVSFSHRKLLSHLVEELLKPYLEVRPYRRPAEERWPEVVDKLCEKVRKFPRAKCEVLEDIDGIIEKDLDILGIGFEEESEGMVNEIEDWIVEGLLYETVRFVEEAKDGVV